MYITIENHQGFIISQFSTDMLPMRGDKLLIGEEIYKVDQRLIDYDSNSMHIIVIKL